MTEGGLAGDNLAGLGPGEIRALAAAAMEVLAAQSASIPDLYHQEHVMGVLRGAAPTFSASLVRLLTIARRASVARGTPR